jgi:type I restriction-modification system DNA methylase subunit/restriction endonuclease S subunit
MPFYQCTICDTTPTNQHAHIESHGETDTHKTKRETMELKLRAIDPAELNRIYGSFHVFEVADDMSIHIIDDPEGINAAIAATDDTKLYRCMICESSLFNPGKIASHCKGVAHKKARSAFEKQLKVLSPEEMLESWYSSDLAEILNDLESYEMSEEDVVEYNAAIAVSKKRSKPEKVAPVKVAPETVKARKQRPSGEVIWTLSQNKETNVNYKAVKSKLVNVIKRCHDILRNAGSIVGQNAQDDIMRILCLRLLQGQFEDEASDLRTRCTKLVTNGVVLDDDFDLYIKYCVDAKKYLIGGDRVEDSVIVEWRSFVEDFLKHVLPGVYSTFDNKFNCDDNNAIIELFNVIYGLDIDDEFKDAFSTACGDIHESFLEYGGGGSAKELGQFFTPRKLIHVMYHALGVDALASSSDIEIYDPCMGTAGFLTRMQQLLQIPTSQIYGCETHLTTAKFGNMGMLLTAGDSNANLLKCNSLSENVLTQRKKFGGIITNPPFGTKMKYDDMQCTHDRMFRNEGNYVPFKTIYPLKYNNGACLFVQHCVYMLADGGFLAIVLPDGELFEGSSKWSKKFREWLCGAMNIQTILKVPGGVFENAGVKTSIVIMTKNGSTKSIRFLETNKACDEVKVIFESVPIHHIAAAAYSLDIGEYTDRIIEEHDVPMIPLGDLCEFKKGEIQSTHRIDGVYKLVSQSSERTHNEYKYDGTSVFISAVAPVGNLYCYVGKCNSTTLLYKFDIINEAIIGDYYIFQLLKYYGLDMCEFEKGAANKTLDVCKFGGVLIPVPSLQVQAEVVRDLTVIEDGIAAIERQIELIKQTKELYKQHGAKRDIKRLLKNCEMKTLGEVCTFAGYAALKMSDFVEGEYPVIGGGRQPAGYHNAHNKAAGSILCSGTGSYAGYISRYETPVWASESFSTHTRDENTLNSEYLYLVLINLQSDIYNMRPAGSGQPHMYATVLEKLLIPVPIPEIQQACVVIYQQKEAKLAEYDAQIIQAHARIEDLKMVAKEIISSRCG